MSGKGVSLLLAFLLFASFQFGNPGSPLDKIVQLYHQANRLYDLSMPTEATDSTALVGFEEIIGKLKTYPRNHIYDTLLFQSYLKKGRLLGDKARYAEAKDAYLGAIGLQELSPCLTDSLFFQPFIYAGSAYYYLNTFDSANYFLRKAEPLIGRFPGLPEKENLYNSLGVLYYDNGDYLQSKNYLGQALEIINHAQPFDTASAVSIQTNIATAFYKLGLYQESISIYNKILRYGKYTSSIYLNMGRAYAALQQYREALSCFRRVDIAKVPGVLNEMASTALQLQQPDSSAYFLDGLYAQAQKKGIRINELDLGINASYRADLLIAREQYIPALNQLQRAIMIFSGNFRNPDIYANPSNFTGTFTYYRLFDALSKKAMAFERQYKKDPQEKYLSASFAVYNSVLSLLAYIEKSYDTDDAKILLKKKSRHVYQEALSVCLELHRLNPSADYLEKAFLISEKNKASVMAASLKERSFRTTPGAEEKLLQTERNIKYNIARLNVRSDQTEDNRVIEAIAGEKARYEIQLSQVQKELEQNNHYYKLKYEDTYPSIKELQHQLGSSQALISLYTTTAGLHVFTLTRSSFSYFRIDSLPALERETEKWLGFLKNTEEGRKFAGGPTGSSLYDQLIKPIQSAIPDKHEWIIIPDGIFYFLPFESLPAGDSGPLLESTAVSYQFSSRFIMNNYYSYIHSSYKEEKVLAFAPFVRQGAGSDQTGAMMDRLPASGEEIAGLPGTRYLDSQATKERFLQEINKYPIVHLATHAVSDVNNTSASFIAFYPKKNSRVEDYLFLEELYGLNMDATRLVIISACETGKGELVNNEGVMSLARAFAYAGCASTVNSLWKADDNATSAILKQFYVYLEKGFSKSKALQQAKLDYIKSNALYKSPDYWSHLVLVGNTEPLYHAKHYGQWAIVLLGLVVLFFILVWIKRKKKKVDASHG